jgi:ribonuclease HI
MLKTHAILFTDGSSRGNPGPGGWGVIVAHGEHVQELGGREDKTTNNRMELMAIVAGLRAVPRDVSAVTIYTDSTYAMKGATQWMKGWQRTHWQTKAGTPVSNRDIWEQMAEALDRKKVEWKVISGHSGIPGNERVDVIATAYADDTRIALYDGDASDYPVDIEKVTPDIDTKLKKDRSKQKAYSYLSLVNKVTHRHKTWASCHERVSGTKAAKFRKAVSLDDELAILKEWGVKSDEVYDVDEE